MRTIFACVFLAFCLIVCAVAPVYAGGEDTVRLNSDTQSGERLVSEDFDRIRDLGGSEDSVFIAGSEDTISHGAEDSVFIGGAEGLTEASDLSTSGFKVARLYDYDSNLTLGRSLLPADFSSKYEFLSSLSSYGECSIDCPFQVVLTASNDSQSRQFMYRSDMVYLYPSDPEIYFHPGERFGSVEQALIGYPTMVMMYPSSANGYADHVMELMDFNGTVYYDGTNYVTDEDDPFLAQVSQNKLTYYNVASPFDFLFDVDCTWAFTSYTESAYYVDDPDMPLSVKIITSTIMLQFYGVDKISGGTCEYVITDVPYFYMCIVPASEKEEAFAQFDIFASTTRTTDEFSILNARESQMLHEIVDQGWTLQDESELVNGLGEGYGSYYEDQFSDYIFDQNDYTTSSGESFKVPTSYDYVYETDNGEIYVTNTTKQPAGSTRLYAN